MSSDLEDLVIIALKSVLDPHVMMSVYDMGLISDLKIEGSEVSLNFTPTSPFCPMGIQLAENVKKAVKKVDGVEKAHITVQGHLQANEINKKLAED